MTCCWRASLWVHQVTEFLLQKPWLADEGGEFAANVNKMIRNLNFQQVIIERMDRLKPGIQLTLKVGTGRSSRTLTMDVRLQSAYPHEVAHV
jgi:hypothetical protein